MKNHKYMLAMLLSSSLLVGCQGDFLNLPSETSLSTAVYYKSQSDFEQKLFGRCDEWSATFQIRD